ncbi:MAG: SCO1664 family protein [Roseiflexaceae bacterium]
MSEPAHEIDIGDVLTLLAKGEIELQGSMPWSSNYTLLALLLHEGMQGLAVYKPRRGERPLWDFPRGTLCQREFAAYLVSAALGWDLVPPTVLRDGPYGVGSVQLFINADQEAHLFTMQKEGGYENVLERLAAFDIIVNNADRKSGHCLKGSDGRLWAIDHGICFHSEYKLRTVLWDYAGEPIRSDILEDLRSLQRRMQKNDYELRIVESLLAADEYQSFRRRVDRLVQQGRYPDPGAGRNIPWPPV